MWSESVPPHCKSSCSHQPLGCTPPAPWALPGSCGSRWWGGRAVWSPLAPGDHSLLPRSSYQALGILMRGHLRGREYLPRSVNSAMERGVGTFAQYSSSLASTPGSVDKRNLPLLLELPWARSSLRARRNPRGTISPLNRLGPWFSKASTLWKISSCRDGHWEVTALRASDKQRVWDPSRRLAPFATVGFTSCNGGRFIARSARETLKTQLYCGINAIILVPPYKDQFSLWHLKDPVGCTLQSPFLNLAESCSSKQHKSKDATQPFTSHCIGTLVYWNFQFENATMNVQLSKH